MRVEESKVFRLSWTEVNLTINQYLLNQAGHYIPCKARMVKRDYWATELYPYEMPPSHCQTGSPQSQPDCRNKTRSAPHGQ